jgi:DNA-binding NarL/FixJ family response regulator
MTSRDVTPADGAPAEPVARLRVVVADDDALLREGIASLLRDAGHEVVGRAHDADDLMVEVRSCVPDVAIVDVRMPPGHADDGLLAAAEIRRAHPTVAVLVLSQHLEASYMLELVGDDASGVGYLLKDRVREVLGLIAEGRSNRAIAAQLAVSPRAVERHVQAIFQKLRLPESEDDNRRVLAVLALLGH